MTEKEIGCDNCYYSFFDEKSYPCSLCIRGIERTDKWQPNKKTKNKTQTETECHNCKHFLTNLCRECFNKELFTNSGYVTQTETEGK